MEEGEGGLEGDSMRASFARWFGLKRSDGMGEQRCTCVKVCWLDEVKTN